MEDPKGPSVFSLDSCVSVLLATEEHRFYGLSGAVWSQCVEKPTTGQGLAGLLQVTTGSASQPHGGVGGPPQARAATDGQQHPHV